MRPSRFNIVRRDDDARNVRWLVVLALLAAIGCGPNTGAVTGKVYRNADVLNSGTIAIRGPDGQIASAMIQEGGGYSIPNAPLGNVEFTVQTFPPSPGVVPHDAPPNSIKIPSLRFQPIADKYRDFKTSGLTLKVVPGPQNHDVRLTN